VTTAGELSEAIASRGSTGSALLLLQLAVVPNAVVWGSSYALGSGFAVGVGTAVAPTGVQLGAVPGLPLLAALPESGAAPAWSLLALLGPLVAGVAAGVVLARRLDAPTPAQAAAWAAAAAVAAGGVMAALAWLSGGGAPGRLAALGPAPVLTWAAATAWLLLGAAPAAWWCVRRRTRS
jgi:hypothetical protein